MPRAGKARGFFLWRGDVPEGPEVPEGPDIPDNPEGPEGLDDPEGPVGRGESGDFDMAVLLLFW